MPETHHMTHIQGNQLKGSSKITVISRLIITLFKYHISSITFYFFHRPASFINFDNL